MATTLGQALYNYQQEYIKAVDTNSKRKIELLDQGWQRINNWWDIYFQSSAEGDTTKANEAITGIKEVLGGVVDSSILPSVSGGIDRRDGIVTVSAGTQTITFASDFGTQNYRLDISVYDTNGVPVLYTRGAKASTGFNVTPTIGGTLEYTAIAL